MTATITPHSCSLNLLLMYLSCAAIPLQTDSNKTLLRRIHQNWVRAITNRSVTEKHRGSTYGDVDEEQVERAHEVRKYAKKLSTTAAQMRGPAKKASPRGGSGDGSRGKTAAQRLTLLNRQKLEQQLHRSSANAAGPNMIHATIPQPMPMTFFKDVRSSKLAARPNKAQNTHIDVLKKKVQVRITASRKSVAHGQCVSVWLPSCGVYF